MVLVGVCMWLLNAVVLLISKKNAFGLLGFVTLVLGVPAYLVAEVFVSAVRIELKAGRAVGLKLLREVLFYPELARTVWGLMLRGIAWLPVAMIAGALLAVPFAGLILTSRSLQVHRGIGASTGSMSYWVGDAWVVLTLLALMLLLLRYWLTVPLVALTRGLDPAVIGASRKFTSGHWQIATGVSLIGVLPTLLHIAARRLVLGTTHASTVATLLDRLVETILVDCWSVPLILMRTQFAADLMGAETNAAEAPLNPSAS